MKCEKNLTYKLLVPSIQVFHCICQGTWLAQPLTNLCISRKILKLLCSIVIKLIFICQVASTSRLLGIKSQSYLSTLIILMFGVELPNFKSFKHTFLRKKNGQWRLCSPAMKRFSTTSWSRLNELKKVTRYNTMRTW